MIFFLSTMPWLDGVLVSDARLHLFGCFSLPPGYCDASLEEISLSGWYCLAGVPASLLAPVSARPPPLAAVSIFLFCCCRYSRGVARSHFVEHGASRRLPRRLCLRLRAAMLLRFHRIIARYRLAAAFFHASNEILIVIFSSHHRFIASFLFGLIARLFLWRWTFRIHARRWRLFCQSFIATRYCGRSRSNKRSAISL